MTRRRVLVVEDEANIADSILYVLEQDGIEAIWVQHGEAALATFEQQSADLIILDVGLPDMNGFDICRELRRQSRVPIIFLTARDAEIDRIVGLELGGDDYVTKPFSPRELLARVNAVLRRFKENSHQSQSQSQPKPSKLEFRGGRFYFDDHALTLTAFETGILALLMAHPEQIFTRQQIMDKVWLDSQNSFDRVIDTHVKTLRQKLKDTTGSVDWIVTHRGLGYSFSNKPGIPACS